MTGANRLETRPDVLIPKAYVRGTDVPASVVLALLRAGLPPGEIVKLAPGVTVEDVAACGAWEEARRRDPASARARRLADWREAAEIGPLAGVIAELLEEHPEVLLGVDDVDRSVVASALEDSPLERVRTSDRNAAFFARARQ